MVLAGLLILAFFSLANVGGGGGSLPDSGFGTITIPVGVFDQTLIINFHRTFTVPPVVTVNHNVVSFFGGTFPQVQDYAIQTGISTQWNLMPAATTEFLGCNPCLNRIGFFTGQLSQNTVDADFIVNMNPANLGAVGSQLEIQYTTDFATWVNSGIIVPIDSCAVTFGTNCITEQDTTPLPANMVGGTPVELRIVGRGGNGINSPIFGNMVVIFRTTTLTNLAVFSANQITKTRFVLTVQQSLPAMFATTYAFNWTATDHSP